MDILETMLQQLSNKRGPVNQTKVAILQSMAGVFELAEKLEKKTKDQNTLSEFLEKCLTSRSKPRAFQKMVEVSKQISAIQATELKPVAKPPAVKPQRRQLIKQPNNQIHIHVNVPTHQGGGFQKAQGINRKKAIPKSIKEKVWYTYMGKQTTEGLCPCCLSESIKIMHFHAGHVISEANGGPATVENLRPICGRCNLQMGAMNMNEYMMKFYGRYLP